MRSILVVGVLFGACATTPPPAAHDAEYETLCSNIGAADRAQCPLMRWTRVVEDVEGGVALRLGPTAPPPNEVERRARCHRAWMAQAPENAMPRCPFGTPNLSIHAEADALVLTSTDAARADEVRRRAHAAFDR